MFFPSAVVRQTRVARSFGFIDSDTRRVKSAAPDDGSQWLTGWIAAKRVISGEEWFRRRSKVGFFCLTHSHCTKASPPLHEGARPLSSCSKVQLTRVSFVYGLVSPSSCFHGSAICHVAIGVYTWEKHAWGKRTLDRTFSQRI